MDTLFTPKIKKLLFDSAFENIKGAIKTKKKEVIICDVTQLETSIAIPRTDWGKVLNSSLEYYIEIEDYSACVEVNKLIKDIEDGQRVKK